MSDFERALTVRDVSEELSIPKEAARRFVQMFGRKVGMYWVIGQGDFRLAQLDGTAAEFVKHVRKRRGRPRKEENKEALARIRAAVE